MPDHPSRPVPGKAAPARGRLAEELFAPVRLRGEELLELLAPFGHAAHVRRHSATVIISRVRLVAALFAVLVPLWSVLDWMVFPWPQWAVLTAMRLASGATFLLLAWPWQATTTRIRADLMLLALLLVPPSFYLASELVLSGTELTEQGRLVARLYALMPNVVLAGLAIFPLTALEVLVFSIPAFLFTLAGIAMGGETPSLLEHGPTLWLMALVMGAAMFSGMSQLHYMAALVARATTDPLTGAHTRRSGCETLDLLFRLSARQGTPLTLAFFDIDHFKAINDRFGHEEGDKALRQVADSLRRGLRTSDVLVRWGGEEFLAILNNTSVEGADIVIRRLRAQGLGQRPDGAPITASIGVAERGHDRIQDWPHLVELADRRMYVAKHQGRDRAVMPDPAPADEPVEKARTVA
ncbi:GGDEF domain-containing protein [Aerophototrophica crusticola]|uniref:diguanylate cyclase n=1 Tax=Aerophototrophica crusticola TaxID=1709002 RepID=A0A858R3T2_9PROT|nr:GGDEF domain-containing protein [Rhodospirillaceae bacterium B3]